MTALVFSPLAHAGSVIDLPAGEEAELWAPAFAFAGLTDLSSAFHPHIHIEDAGEHWVLRAYDGRGNLRTAEVDAPTTAGQRERVALVAGGLIRALSSAEPPAPQASPPPPPPALPAATALPAPVLEPTPPAPAVAAEPPPAAVPEPVRDLEPYPDARAAPHEEALYQAPLIMDLDAPRAARARGRKAATMAPLSVGGGVALRPQNATGALFTVGTRLAMRNRWSAEADVAVIAQHPMFLAAANARVGSVDVELLGPYRFGRSLSAGPLVGLSYRAFQQDGTPIEDAIVPRVGGVVSLTAIGGRWWALRSVTKATVDLGIVRLVTATGVSRAMSPVGLQSGIAFVIGHRVDPSIQRKTPRRH